MNLVDPDVRRQFDRELGRLELWRDLEFKKAVEQLAKDSVVMPPEMANNVYQTQLIGIIDQYQTRLNHLQFQYDATRSLTNSFDSVRL